MSKVMSIWREKLASNKKSAIHEAGFDVMYPTGFSNVDYVNGTTVHVRSENINIDYEAVGIVDGTSNTIISRPGSGKSTLVTQWIGNLLRSNPDSEAYIDDIEGSLPAPRKEYLLGLQKKDISERVFIRNDGITTENVYEQIRFIRDTKRANQAELQYDTGLYDTDGNRIFKFIPTFYFIDSFAMLLPEDVNDDEEMEASKNQAMSLAKKNTSFIKKIGQLLKEANIILFTINHIQDDVQMGIFHKPVQVEGLKEGERLPGGKTALYLANNMFRLDKIKTLKEEEAFKIAGSVVNFTICKSRTNANLRSVPLIFDKSRGLFDNELSVFYYLKENGYIAGTGRGMFIDGYPEYKFSQADFKAKLFESLELQSIFVEVAHEALSKLLSNTRVEEAQINSFDLSRAIMAKVA